MIEIRHRQMDKTRDTQQAYNQIYEAAGIQLRDSFYLWLLSLLGPAPIAGKRLLDISCGQGRLVSFAQQHGFCAFGLDFAVSAVRIGAQENPVPSWLAGDGEQLPFPDASFDYVTHIGSLEHYQQPQTGIQEIRRVLKNDGTACVLLPNSYGLFGNILNVLRTGDVFDDGQPLQRYNTRLGWEQMLQRGGLRVVRVHKYEREWPRTQADRLWYARHPAKLARLLISPLIPVNLANCLVYICRPADLTT